LNTDIENINGIVGIKTKRTDTNVTTNGVSLCIFNPVHLGRDLKFVETFCQLRPFQIPYIENDKQFKEKIIVETEALTKTVIEY